MSYRLLRFLRAYTDFVARWQPSKRGSDGLTKAERKLLVGRYRAGVGYLPAPTAARMHDLREMASVNEGRIWHRPASGATSHVA